VHDADVAKLVDQFPGQSIGKCGFNWKLSCGLQVFWNSVYVLVLHSRA
jgi:hypothetical protein